MVLSLSVGWGGYWLWVVGRMGGKGCVGVVGEGTGCGEVVPGGGRYWGNKCCLLVT